MRLVVALLALFALGCVESSSDSGEDIAKDTSRDVQNTQDQRQDSPQVCDPSVCESLVCDMMTGLCVDPACDDFVQNGDETGEDCGGGCAPCAEGEGCEQAQDCQSGLCQDGRCEPLDHCLDRVKSGDEFGVDCGGSCPACEGAPCFEDSECLSGYCLELFCKTPNCQDGIENGEESGVDCGGSCPPCQDQECTVDDDCDGGVCTEGVCVFVETCGDGVQNQGETDVDCGGGCAPCELGQACLVLDDCAAGLWCGEGGCRHPLNCLEILEGGIGESGLYFIDPDGVDGRALVEVYCEMEREGGGWTQIAHVRKELGMPYPGREQSDPATITPHDLGYSIDAQGLAFSEMALTHNGLMQGDIFVVQLAEPAVFNSASQDQVFVQENGRYTILSLSEAQSGGHGDVALTCFNSTTSNCLEVLRTDTYGAVSTATGACMVLNAGDGTSTTCGGWGLEPNAGDATWTAVGGRVFVR